MTAPGTPTCDFCRARGDADDRLFVESPDRATHICEECVAVADRQLHRHRAEHGLG